MPRTISFEGSTVQVPDDFTDDEVSGLLKKAPAPSPVDQQAGALKQAVSFAVQQNPDQYAKQLQLQKQTGIPPVVSAGNEPAIQQAADANKIDPHVFTMLAPRTSAWATDPHNAAVSGVDEMHRLGTIEQHAATMRAYTPTLWDNITDSLRQGVQAVTGKTTDQLKQAAYEYPLTRGGIDVAGGAAGMVGNIGSFFGWHGNGPDKQNLLQRIDTNIAPENNTDQAATFHKSNGFDWLAKNVAPMVPAVLATGGVSLLADTLGISQAAAKVIAGLTVGGAFTADQAGRTYTDVAGRGGSDYDARLAANRVATINALPNALFGATDVLPVLRDNPLLTSLGLGGATGASGQVAQNVVTGQKPTKGILSAALQGAAMQGGMHLGTEAFFGGLAQSVQAAEESKLRERSPEHFQDALQTIFHGDDSLRIPADKFNEYFLSKQMDPAAVAGQIGAANYGEAVVSGGDVEVPKADFLGKLDPEHQKALLADIVDPATGITLRQHQEGREELQQWVANGGPEKMQAEAEQADSETASSPEWQSVKEDLRQRYVDAGETPDVAETLATKDANVYANLAKSAGMKPAELLHYYNPKVVEGEAPRAAEPLDIGAELERKIAGDLKGAIREYSAIKETDNGRILNTDDARELSEHYRADRSRSADVHEPASAFIKELYKKKLAEPVAENRDPLVLFTAGGTGAGKTSSLGTAEGKALYDAADIIYDTNMNKFASADTKIQQALDSGRKVAIQYTYREPVEALVNGALPRAMKRGRTVPMKEHVRTHVGARKVFDELRTKYAADPRVTFSAVDNSHGKGNARTIPVDSVPKIDDTGLSERLHDALEREHKDGRISETVKRGFDSRGIRQAAGGSGSHAAGTAAGREAVQSAGVPQAGGSGASGQPESQGAGRGVTLYQSKPPISGADGRTTPLLTPSGKIDAQYRLVEAADLVPSHNPHTFEVNKAYPEGVQERAYDKSKEAQARVIEQSQNYEPAYTVNTNPDAVNGPPVITPDGIVLGGNSRAMATTRLYADGRGDVYRNALRDQAGDYGLKPEDVDGMKEPVLVRQVEAPASVEGMRRLGSDLNRSMTGALGAAEKAVSVGKNITPDTLRWVSDELNAGDSTLREMLGAKGGDVLRRMVADGALTERERPQYVDAQTGGLNEAGKSFVEKALLGSVFDDPRLLESAPKSITAKIERSLGSITSFAARPDEWNILPALRAAIAEHGAIQRSGSSVELRLGQTDMFGEARNPLVDTLVRALDEKPNAVREAFESYARDSDANLPGQARMFGSAEPFDAFNNAFGSKLTAEDYHDGLVRAAASEPAVIGTHAPSDSGVPEQPATEPGNGGEGSQPAAARAEVEPPVPAGMTRLYHGSVEHGRYDGSAWFSTNRAYAENYRPGAELQYVDYPTDKVNEVTDPDGIGQTVAAGFHFAKELDSSETGPRKSLAAPRTAETQTPKATPRGWFRVLPDGTYEIGRTNIGDLSTFVHEPAHGYLQIIRDLATRESASDTIKGDYQRILDFLGAKDGEPLTREQHEKWARANEQYLREGQAPSEGLKGVFQRFAIWLGSIYKKASDLGVELNDNIRGVFDRLYAAEEGVNRVARESGPRLFNSAEDAGWTEKEFQFYAHARGLELDQAKAEILAKLNEAALRDRTDEWREEERNAREAVSAKIDRTQEYVAIRSLRRGALDDDTPLTLNRDALVKQFGEDRAKELQRLHPGLYRKEGGVDPETAAEVFGFNSAAEMMGVLRHTPRRSEAIETAVREHMTAKHGDIRFDGSLNDQARMAVENQKRAENLHRELKALQKKLETLKADGSDQRAALRSIQVAPIESYRDAAQQMVESKAVADLQPHRYLDATRKYSREAFDALRKGSIEDAVQAKHKELLNHFLFREATKAKDYIGKFESYVKRMQTKGVQQKLGLAGADYRDQFNRLLFRYGLGAPPNEAPTRTLAEWASSLYDEGKESAIDHSMFDETRAVHYRAASVAEVRKLHDALINIKHLASLELGITVNGQKVEFDAARERMVAQAQQSLKSNPVRVLERNATKGEKLADLVQRGDAMLMRTERLMEWLDGGKQGPWHDYLWNLASDSQGHEYGLQEDVTKRIGDALENMPKEQRMRMLDKVEVEGIPETVTRHDLVSMAFNMGNEGNLNRLEKTFISHGWDPAALDKIKGTLTREEWQFVQAGWESLKPLGERMVELEKRLTGLPPVMVKPQPFSVELADGSTLHLDGGYYPVMMDSRFSKRGAQADAGQTAQNLMEAGYGRATTSRGYTKERTGFGGPLMLDYEQVLTQHTAKVIKDITHREFMLAANKLLMDPAIRQTLRETLGAAYEEKMMPWLRTIINDRNGSSVQGLGDFSRAVRALRSNLTVATLSFKISTSLLQWTHAPRMLLLTKPGSYAQAMVDFMAHPMEMTEQIKGLSPNEMRFRGENLDRDIREKLLSGTGQKDLGKTLTRVGNVSIKYTDHMLSFPLWMSVYRDALKDHVNLPESDAQYKAMHAADSAVRLGLGSGAPKDLPPAMRNNDLAKLLTMFYSFHNGIYNQIRDIGHNAKGARSIPKLTYGLAMSILVPAVLSKLVVGDGPKDDENKGAWAAKRSLLFSMDTMPVLRDVASALDGSGDVKFTPLVSVMTKGAKATKHVLDETPEKDWSGIGLDYLETGMDVAGVPGTTQAMKPVRYAKRVNDGKVSDPNVWDAVVGQGRK